MTPRWATAAHRPKVEETMQHQLITLAFAMCCLTVPALACSENEIEQETKGCYTSCVSRYFDETNKNACVAGCVQRQDEARAACPSITCKIVAGMKICT